MNKMKVAHVITSLQCGGLENLVVQLACSLKQRDVDSIIISLKADGELTDIAENQGLKVFRLNKTRGVELHLVKRLREIFLREKTRIVHSHNIGPLYYSTAAAALGGISCINTRHGRSPLKANWLFWKLNKNIVAVSEDTKKALLQNNLIRSDKIRVIYNGIDVKLYNSRDPDRSRELREKLGIRETDRVITTVARLSKEKDHMTLIEAVRELTADDKDIRLLIVGDGPLYENLRTSVRNYMLEKYVKFLGYRNDVRDILELSEIFVLSSRSEGIPLTVLEAMSAARPVVATNVGGIHEVIKDGETGFLTDVGDVWGMSQKIKELLGNRSLSKSVGEKGKDQVCRKFTVERMRDDYIALYETLCK